MLRALRNWCYLLSHKSIFYLRQNLWVPKNHEIVDSWTLKIKRKQFLEEEGKFPVLKNEKVCFRGLKQMFSKLTRLCIDR